MVPSSSARIGVCSTNYRSSCNVFYWVAPPYMYMREILNLFQRSAVRHSPVVVESAKRAGVIESERNGYE